MSNPRNGAKAHSSKSGTRNVSEYNRPDKHRNSHHDNEHSSTYIKIQLKKGKLGYGFAFIYDKNPLRKDNRISVTKIVPGGVAEADGRLKVGDIIISVNDIVFSEIPYVTAIETLKNVGPSITLIISRLKVKFNVVDDDCEYYSDSQPLDVDLDYSSDEDLHFQQFQVKLTKQSAGGLGIHIHGGYDEENEDDESYISISKLSPNGVADLDGNLRIGDIILQVNGTSLKDCSYEEAIDILKSTGKHVTLYCGRFVKAKQITSKNQRY